VGTPIRERQSPDWRQNRSDLHRLIPDWPNTTKPVLSGRSDIPMTLSMSLRINILQNGIPSALIWVEVIMRSLMIGLISLTLAATGFAQSRHGGGGGGGSRGGARAFSGGAVRGGYAGGGVSRGFVGSNRGFVGVGRPYVGGYYGGYGYGYGVGLGYAAPYAPPCYGPSYYGDYNCGYAPYGYPAYGYYGAPVARGYVPRAMIAPRPGVIVGGGWRRFSRR
jgi:hypothetical protein